MIVTFEGQDFNFNFEDLDIAQARKIKRELGLSIKQWQDGLSELDPDCLVGLYWLMHAQNGHALDMNKVNFKIAEFGEAFSNAQQTEEEKAPKAPRAQR